MLSQMFPQMSSSCFFQTVIQSPLFVIACCIPPCFFPLKHILEIIPHQLRVSSFFCIAHLCMSLIYLTSLYDDILKHLLLQEGMVTVVTAAIAFYKK